MGMGGCEIQWIYLVQGSVWSGGVFSYEVDNESSGCTEGHNFFSS